VHTKFWSENLKGRDRSEGLVIGEKIILEWIFRGVEWEGVEWRHLAQNRDQ